MLSSFLLVYSFFLHHIKYVRSVEKFIAEFAAEMVGNLVGIFPTGAMFLQKS